MRQRGQKGLLQRTEKYDMVKDTARGGQKTEGLPLLDKCKLVRDFEGGRGKSAKLYS